MNPQLTQRVHTELTGQGIFVSAYKRPEVRYVLNAECILARGGNLLARIADQQIAALRQGGDETGMVNAAIFLSREEHSSISGVHREGHHSATEVSDSCNRCIGPQT